MRALRPVVFGLLSALALTSCKSAERSRSPEKTADVVPEIPGLPEPLPLPAEPPAGVVHLANPLQIADVAAAYGAGVIPPVTELLPTLAAAVRGSLERQLIPHLALDRPWNGAQIAGQTILQLPIRPESMPAVASLVAPLAAEGSFGAKRIAQSPVAPGPAVIYFDASRRVVTLAQDLRGIATGYALGAKYGTKPIRVRIDAATAAQWGIELAFQRVDIEGTDPQRLHARLYGPHPELQVPLLAELEAGALTGMLESKLLTLGASSRYASHEQEVARVQQTMRREIAAQSIFIRGTLEDLYQRFSTLARHWNGRVMVGVAPARHLLLGLGTDQARAAENAALHLVAGLLENLKLAQSLGLGGSVPDLRFSRSALAVGPIGIHSLTMRNAVRFLPRDLAPLIDPQGNLRIAWATAEHVGGAMIAIGPTAPTILEAWIRDAERATAGSQSRQHWASATIAVNAAQLEHVSANPYAILMLQPTRPPVRVVVQRLNDGYDVRVQPG